MRQKVNFDEEIYPPFIGFPKAGIDFLRQLKKNNRREWFAEHKSDYDNFVKFPMQTLIASLKVPMMKLAPEIDLNPRRSIFRIYRDTRFSKDKTPFKTNVAAVFHLKGHWQDSAGYYIHVEPGHIYVGGGIYMPNSNQLKLIRQSIAERSDEFLSIAESKGFKRKFTSLEGEKLRRAPLGYPHGHKMIDWVKYKSYYTGVEWDERECYTSVFVNKVVSVYKDLLPLIRFLNKALGET